MSNQDLEARLTRLEYYFSLMRDMVVDPESYALWDYMISEELEEEQAHKIIEILKKHYAELNSGKEESNELIKSALYVDLNHLLTSFGKPVSENSARSIVLRASKLPIFPHYASLL
ncbi:DUF1878 family protein [Saccharibacillus brassicae]|uniref:DUF1878 family protein n=1 Tax=Saccharibacillus brassicae TaxID=2583377 RepID=A0A4Y6UXC0_SACBS|nr:DUF1878 family protein [Saccharibacillus brassicae]QDH21774.1 DUF1878 family protein [Saccharibacillus brassicae]